MIPRSRRPLGLIIAAALPICVALTLVSSVPGDLPGVSLGSVALLHIERAVGALLAVVLVASVLTRSWRGEVPVEFSGQGLKYAVYEAAENTSQSLAVLTTGLETLRTDVDALERRLDAVEGEE